MLRGKAATLLAERVKVTDEAGREVDVKAEIEALNSDVDGMLAAQAAEGEGDIDVDDLSVDVADTIESQAETDEAPADEAPADEAAADTTDEA